MELNIMQTEVIKVITAKYTTRMLKDEWPQEEEIRIQRELDTQFPDAYIKLGDIWQVGNKLEVDLEILIPIGEESD